MPHHGTACRVSAGRPWSTPTCFYIVVVFIARALRIASAYMADHTHPLTAICVANIIKVESRLFGVKRASKQDLMVIVFR